MKRIEELEKQIRQTQREEEGGSASAGSSADAQALRELENRLDKAVIKNQEALFIGKTYKQIIDRLQQDRLTFDGRVTALEQTIVMRRQEIARLEVRRGPMPAYHSCFHAVYYLCFYVVSLVHLAPKHLS